MADKKLSQKDVARLVRSHGMCCGFNVDTREYRVSFPRVQGTSPADIEATAHYTDDPQDAIGTAQAMSQPGWKHPIIGATPAVDPTDGIEATVESLVEPEDGTTRYGPVVRAIADRLNRWELLGGPIQEVHDALFNCLRTAEDIACTLDSLVVAALAKEGK